MATSGTRRELESLIAGENVTHRIRQELTYRELYDNIDNLWSVLFLTGYLTQRDAEAFNLNLICVSQKTCRRERLTFPSLI